MATHYIDPVDGNGGLSADDAIKTWPVGFTYLCIGAGTKWWGVTARPSGFGEPLPDWDIDIGRSQSTFSPYPPSNL